MLTFETVTCARCRGKGHISMSRYYVDGRRGTTSIRCSACYGKQTLTTSQGYIAAAAYRRAVLKACGRRGIDINVGDEIVKNGLVIPVDLIEITHGVRYIVTYVEGLRLTHKIDDSTLYTLNMPWAVEKIERDIAAKYTGATYK